MQHKGLKNASREGDELYSLATKVLLVKKALSGLVERGGDLTKPIDIKVKPDYEVLKPKEKNTEKTPSS